jgi:hypothetical protein
MVSVLYTEKQKKLLQEFKWQKHFERIMSVDLRKTSIKKLIYILNSAGLDKPLKLDSNLDCDLTFRLIDVPASVVLEVGLLLSGTQIEKFEDHYMVVSKSSMFLAEGGIKKCTKSWLSRFFEF